MATETRPYTKKVRAEQEEETRRRITESAVQLHGSLGPARTSISAIAELAGVRRATVYRHFPDEAALFEACSSHWAAANPAPDPTAWFSIADPAERLRTALEQLYGYYRRNERMLANLLRDEDTVEVVRERFQAFHQFVASIRAPLVAGRGLRGRSRRTALAATGHALAFGTWRSLAIDEGLSDREAAALMAGWVDAAA